MAGVLVEQHAHHRVGGDDLHHSIRQPVQGLLVQYLRSQAGPVVGVDRGQPVLLRWGLGQGREQGQVAALGMSADSHGTRSLGEPIGQVVRGRQL